MIPVSLSFDFLIEERKRRPDEFASQRSAVNLSQSNYDNPVALFLIRAAFAIAIVTLSLVFKISFDQRSQLDISDSFCFVAIPNTSDGGRSPFPNRRTDATEGL